MTRQAPLPRHRRWLAALLALGALFAWPLPQGAHADGKPVLHVFLQLDAKSGVVEKTLQARLPGLGVTVFGRFRDFDDASAAGKPDAVLSIGPVLDARGSKPSLQGTRGGKPSEPYVLASVGQPLTGALGGKTIGAVDLLSREGTQSFITGLLKTTDVKIKRVAKVEDLLPLLEFAAADAIVLPSSMLAKFMERTRLPIKTRDLPGAQVGLPAVAVLNPAVRDQVVSAFQKLDGPTKNLLGIEDWSIR
jgi:hypothetical protein